MLRCSSVIPRSFFLVSSHSISEVSPIRAMSAESHAVTEACPTDNDEYSYIPTSNKLQARYAGPPESELTPEQQSVS